MYINAYINKAIYCYTLCLYFTNLGFAGTANDKKPYSILTYANGLGYKIDNGARPDMSKDDRGKEFNPSE